MTSVGSAVVVLAAALAQAACMRSPDEVRTVPAGAEAMSLLGDTLRAPALSDATRRSYEARLDTAVRNAAARPDDPDALIWLGRRTAYLGHYREAITIFSRGAARWPDDARMYRHRGHRWITVREFDRAAQDFERAAQLVRGRPDETEPDGLPNARGIPTSTLQSNIFYHLGLTYYLRRDYSRALRAWQQCARVSTNPDMDVATRYWHYLTLRRMGRHEEAAALLVPVTPELAIIENGSYHRLLLLFKGTLPAESLTNASESVDVSTASYGLSAWLALEGNREQARYFQRRARSGTQWGAFGYIAAEADLATPEAR